MAYNPKAKTVGEIVQKDVSKKSLKLIAKKFGDSTKMTPFFIKADHKFPDGEIGPLFIFGKIKKFRSEIRNLRGNTELHGLCYVETEADGSLVLCLAPSKGKLGTKQMLLRRAMKEAFTTAFSHFKLLDPIEEKTAEAATEAAEQMEDDLNEEMEETLVGVRKRDKINEQPEAETVSQAVQQMRERLRKMEEIIQRMEENKNPDTHKKLNAMFLRLLAEVQNKG